MEIKDQLTTKEINTLIIERLNKAFQKFCLDDSGDTLHYTTRFSKQRNVKGFIEGYYATQLLARKGENGIIKSAGFKVLFVEAIKA